MKKTIYPDGSNEPDTKYNDYVNANSEIEEPFQCPGDCDHCAGCPDGYDPETDSSVYDNDPALDEMLLKSSALTKNSNKDNQYTYSNDIPATGKILPNTGKRKHIPFKEQWEQVDEICPTCNKVSKEAKGITRQNIKRLFSFKGDPMSWVMFLLICAMLFFANLSWDLMTTPVNCSNASNIILVDGSNLNSNNQMPIIGLDDLNLSDINKSYCQYTNPDASDYCQNITLVGNDSDEYGCKGSAGYSWCENKSKCIRPFEETCSIIDLNQSNESE